MNASLLAVLNDAERLLVAQTELADEHGPGPVRRLAALHIRGSAEARNRWAPRSLGGASGRSASSTE